MPDGIGTMLSCATMRDLVQGGILSVDATLLEGNKQGAGTSTHHHHQTENKNKQIKTTSHLNHQQVEKRQEAKPMRERGRGNSTHAQEGEAEAPEEEIKSNLFMKEALENENSAAAYFNAANEER